ncbi:MAG: insulinase family protein, partial [Thermoanaerobaculia bacterium]
MPSLRRAAVLSLSALLMTAAASRAADPVLLPVPADPMVSFKVWFKVGSQDDPPGKEGLAYLTGQLLSEGSTTANSFEEILRQLYPLASGYSVRVDREMTTLSGRTHKDNVEPY